MRSLSPPTMSTARPSRTTRPPLRSTGRRCLWARGRAVRRTTRTLRLPLSRDGSPRRTRKSSVTNELLGAVNVPPLADMFSSHGYFTGSLHTSFPLESTPCWWATLCQNFQVSVMDIHGRSFNTNEFPGYVLLQVQHGYGHLRVWECVS